VVDREIRNIILQFVNALTAKGIHVEKAILYGSHTPRNIRPGSDLDIAIVSPDFGKDRYEERKMLLQLAWRIDPRIETIPISSKFYENDTKIPLIYEMKQKGIELESI